MLCEYNPIYTNVCAYNPGSKHICGHYLPICCVNIIQYKVIMDTYLPKGSPCIRREATAWSTHSCHLALITTMIIFILIVMLMGSTMITTIMKISILMVLIFCVKTFSVKVRAPVAETRMAASPESSRAIVNLWMLSA